jgi:hypothetical protein
LKLRVRNCKIIVTSEYPEGKVSALFPVKFRRRKDDSIPCNPSPLGIPRAVLDECPKDG